MGTECSGHSLQFLTQFSSWTDMPGHHAAEVLARKWHFHVWRNESPNGFVQSRTFSAPARPSRWIIGRHPRDHPWCKLACWFGSPSSGLEASLDVVRISRIALSKPFRPFFWSGEVEGFRWCNLIRCHNCLFTPRYHRCHHACSASRTSLSCSLNIQLSNTR